MDLRAKLNRQRLVGASVALETLFYVDLICRNPEKPNYRRTGGNHPPEGLYSCPGQLLAFQVIFLSGLRSDLFVLIFFLSAESDPVWTGQPSLRRWDVGALFLQCEPGLWRDLHVAGHSSTGVC